LTEQEISGLESSGQLMQKELEGLPESALELVKSNQPALKGVRAKIISTGLATVAALGWFEGTATAQLRTRNLPRRGVQTIERVIRTNEQRDYAAYRSAMQRLDQEERTLDKEYQAERRRLIQEGEQADSLVIQKLDNNYQDRKAMIADERDQITQEYEKKRKKNQRLGIATGILREILR
jgi:hypothetical protein